MIMKYVNKRESGAGYVFFLGRAEPADDALAERRFAAAEVARQQDQDGRSQMFRELPAQNNCFLG